MNKMFSAWWKDQKETYKFAKQHPIIFTVSMISILLLLNLLNII